VAASAIPPLVALLCDGSIKGMAEAAGAILHLSAVNPSTVVAASAIPPLLVALLSGGLDEGREYAERALSNLVAGKDNIPAVADAMAGAILLLVELLRGGSDEGKANAAGVLGNLGHGSGANMAAVVAAGAILLLVELLRGGLDKGRANAAVALGNLVHGSIRHGSNANKAASWQRARSPCWWSCCAAARTMAGRPQQGR
jgi:hypothetical protein